MENSRVQLNTARQIKGSNNKDLARVDDAVLLTASPFDAFNYALNRYEVLNPKPHRYYSYLHRACLNIFCRLGFEKIYAPYQNMPSAYPVLVMDRDGKDTTEPVVRQELGTLQASVFMRNSHDLAAHLVTGINSSKREEVQKVVSDLDDRSFKFGKTIKEFFLTQLGAKAVQAEHFRRTAFVVSMLKDPVTANLKDGQIAEMYQAASTLNWFGKLWNSLSNSYRAFRPKLDQSRPNIIPEIPLNHQYIHPIRTEANCLKNDYKYINVSAITNPDYRDLEVYPACSSCPLFTAQEGVKCGLAAIRARKVHEYQVSNYTAASNLGRIDITERLKAAQIIKDQPLYLE